MSDKSLDRKMALSGIRVIDFGQIGIDPIATSYLADFGAEVIKVESYSSIDPGRRGDLFVDETRDPNRNLLFARYNQNKLSVLINLKHPKGVALAKKLVSIADVVIENFTVEVIHRLGLDYEVLRKVKPDIIMISASSRLDCTQRPRPVRSRSYSAIMMPSASRFPAVRSVIGMPTRTGPCSGKPVIDMSPPSPCAI